MDEVLEEDKMINSNTSFGKLKAAVVGRELQVDQRLVDITFNFFYREALQQSTYDFSSVDYCITKELVEKRNAQLDDLAKLLQKQGVKVHRPEQITKITRVQTPTFKSYVSPASNVRDLTLVYQNKIVETPTFVRSRYFENEALYGVFSKFYDNGNGGQWLRAPLTKLAENTIDLDDWRQCRDFSNVPPSFEMAIDAAQFLRIGKDVIVNATTYNHYLGLQWVKSLFPEARFHVIQAIDNHIDGAIVCLKPGVFLCNPKCNVRAQLPAKFQKWTFLEPEDVTSNIDVSAMTNRGLRLASSAGMDINVLSLSESDVVVSKRAIGVCRVLEKNGFNVLPIELENGEIFGGGIHCSTLDLVREDEFLDYA